MNNLDEILEHMNCSCSDGNCIFRPSTAKGLVTNGAVVVLEITQRSTKLNVLFVG